MVDPQPGQVIVLAPASWQLIGSEGDGLTCLAHLTLL
jgi:hypothetical protein